MNSNTIKLESKSFGNRCPWLSVCFIGKSNPYCELTMGAQCYTSRHQSDTLNPKWNFSCHFFIKDLYQDVLCLTIFERDQFSPDGEFSHAIAHNV